MSVFSTNQARHLYVASSKGNSTLGAILPKADDAKTHLYFEYMGPGGLVRSDLIDIKNIMYAKVTKADAMARKLNAVTVTLNGDPVGGQDYILKVAFRQFMSPSDANIYTKFGMVHATSGMTVSNFYKELAISLAKNFSREGVQLVKFYLVGGGEVTATTDAASLTGTYTGVTIEEVEQDWVLGVKPQTPVYFEVSCGTVTVDGDEVTWGEVKKVTAIGAPVKNGKIIADLEYFCMGERGDTYRNIGWPNVIPTKYMVDPTKEYHVLDIHYAYVGSNEAVQKSEKDLTIVCADAETLKTITETVNSEAGLTIDVTSLA